MSVKKRCFTLFLAVLVLCCLMATTALAAGTGDVAGAVEDTWNTASGQIKAVVNNVVFPAIDLILAVFFFVKMGMAYFDFRKSGQFEWTGDPFCLSGLYTDCSYIHLGHHRYLRRAL